MTEQQVKGMITAYCNWIFGANGWRLYSREGLDMILVETKNKDKFLGTINEVYCELEKSFFAVAGKR